jgi:hypothetical protein
VAFVVGISPTLFQPVGSGSHLYPATPTHRAVGSSGEVLRTLVGHSLWDCLALSFCTLIVSHFKGFVKRFLWNFFKFLLPFSLESEWIGVTRLPRISSWLLLHCTTSWVVCQEGCWKKSQLFFNGRFPTQYGHGCDTPTFRFCIPTGPAQLVRCLTLLTPIVYHIHP